MIPFDRIAIAGKGLRSDTAAFLNALLVVLLNHLADLGIETKDVDILGANDIIVFRGTSLTVISFSRGQAVAKPSYSELALPDVLNPEPQTDSMPGLWQPLYLYDALLDHYLLELKFVLPFSLAFPTRYLALAGPARDAAVLELSKMLVRAAKEDIERKKRTIIFNPIFHGRGFLLELDPCLVLLPFNKPCTDIYDSIIKPTVDSDGLRCVRADEMYSATPVIEDILEKINKALMVIADISGNNQNVMYELGICHTIGKTVMMITQSPDHIPFNFRHMRCHPYSNDIPGANTLRTNIQSVIKHAKSLVA